MGGDDVAADMPAEEATEVAPEMPEETDEAAA